MEKYDIDYIHIVLTGEFGELFLPEKRGLSYDQVIYEGVLKHGSAASLMPMIQRFRELGYDIQVLGTEPRLALIFTIKSQESAILNRRGKKYGIHLLLLVLTLISTLWAGALQYDINILKEPAKIWMGLPFAIPLLMILLAHEMGHYFLSLRHNIRTTLPYFIPFPNIIGTMGAIIRMKSPIPDRDALIDVGMAGPLAGVIVAVPVTIIGLMMSEITIQISSGAGGGIMLGESLLFKILSWLIYGPLPPNANITIHPVAFAGWVGLLITFMNLFPASQLDGGHISYALFGHRHKFISKITCFAFLIMGIFYWPWLIWMAFVFFIGIGHPPPINDIEPINRKKRTMGLICLAIFILTFIPRPFYGPDMPMDLLSLLKAFAGLG